MSKQFAVVFVTPPTDEIHIVREFNAIEDLTMQMSRQVEGPAHILVIVTHLTEDQREELLELMSDAQIDAGYITPNTIRIDQH